MEFMCKISGRMCKVYSLRSADIAVEIHQTTALSSSCVGYAISCVRYTPSVQPLMKYRHGCTTMHHNQPLPSHTKSIGSIRITHHYCPLLSTKTSTCPSVLPPIIPLTTACPSALLLMFPALIARRSALNPIFPQTPELSIPHQLHPFNIPFWEIIAQVPIITSDRRFLVLSALSATQKYHCLALYSPSPAKLSFVTGRRITALLTTSNI